VQDVSVRLAHHSSAIEGNTISLPDTVSIILYTTIPSKANLREFYEIENHKEALIWKSIRLKLQIVLTKNKRILLTKETRDKEREAR